MRKLALILLLAACAVPQSEVAPLEQASRRGDAKAIAALVARGADPNAPVGRTEWTPLLHAVHRGQLRSVRALLDAGADVNRPSSSGMTPLMMAAGYGNRPMVELLLGRGANPGVRDDHGDLALDYALTGMTDIDAFTFFRCQSDTAHALACVSPQPQRWSTRWATMKGC